MAELTFDRDRITLRDFWVGCMLANPALTERMSGEGVAEDLFDRVEDLLCERETVVNWEEKLKREREAV